TLEPGAQLPRRAKRRAAAAAVRDRGRAAVLRPPLPARAAAGVPRHRHGETGLDDARTLGLAANGGILLRRAAPQSAAARTLRLRARPAARRARADRSSLRAAARHLARLAAESAAAVLRGAARARRRRPDRGGGGALAGRRHRRRSSSARG